MDNISELYPVEEGKISVVIMTDYTSTPRELDNALKPWYKAGYLYVLASLSNEDGYTDMLLATEYVDLDEESIDELLSTIPGGTYCEVQGRDFIVYHGEVEGI